MKEFSKTFLTICLMAFFSSCSTETFHSGAMALDGTTVTYLVSESDQSLIINADGITPNVTIYVKLLAVEASAFTENVVDSIITIPHENIVSLNKGIDYSLFLEKNGETIGLGQFNLQ